MLQLIAVIVICYSRAVDIELSIYMYLTKCNRFQAVDCNLSPCIWSVLDLFKYQPFVQCFINLWCSTKFRTGFVVYIMVYSTRLQDQRLTGYHWDIVFMGYLMITLNLHLI